MVPVVVIVGEVLISILPVLARLIAVGLAVLAVLIAKFVSRRESILQVVAPLLRTIRTLRSLTGATAAVNSWAIAQSR
jgi:hypothetical protein